MPLSPLLSPLRLTLALATAAAVIGAGLAAAPSATTSTTVKSLRFDPPRRIEVEANLARIGLTLQSVAAAGLSSNQVLSCVGDAADSIRENINALRAADIAAGQARNDVDRLERLIRAGLSTPEDRTALTNAQAALASARAQANALLHTASVAGLAQLGSEPLAVINTVHANAAWDLPLQYRAANRGEPDWVNLRDALADQRGAAHLNIEPAPASIQIINAANSNPAVASAAANLNTLPSLQAAWIQAVGE